MGEEKTLPPTPPGLNTFRSCDVVGRWLCRIHPFRPWIEPCMPGRACPEGPITNRVVPLQLADPVHPPHIFGGACQLTDAMGIASGFVQTELFGHGPCVYSITVPVFHDHARTTARSRWNQGGRDWARKPPEIGPYPG